MSTHDEHEAARTVGLDGLKALAHPLRVQIFEVLSMHGEQTASSLADRLGESSGATSYHLRQLEKHGYVREVADRGTARERWWERVPGPVHIGSAELNESQAARAATRVVMREWLHHREAGVREIVERGFDELSAPWKQAIVLHSASVHVTPQQLEQFNERMIELLTEFTVEHRGQRIPGSRPVQLQYYGFPVLDGIEIPESTDPQKVETS